MHRYNGAKLNKSIFILITIVLSISAAVAQTTEFNYQGTLRDGANPANGNYDLEFRLYDAAAAGTQIGLSLTRTGVAVNSGSFNVQLDFGAVYPGANRYLEIRVKPAGPGLYTTLTPRQKISSSPYTVKSLSAENAASLGGVAANQYISLTGGNFNIAGNGTIGGTLSGGIVNATTQFNIGGARVLSNDGFLNTIVGVSAGDANTGSINAFFGTAAGKANTSGSSNSFFGSLAGERNTTGGENAFFGRGSGGFNTTGSGNSFFGAFSGDSNTIGARNSFFGRSSGSANLGGSDNAFFGYFAGNVNTSGASNAFFGAGAGAANTIASGNSFFGADSGSANTTGSNNAFFGSEAGATNTIGQLNTFLGTASGKNNTDGAANTFVGTSAGFTNSGGTQNTFVGRSAGRLNLLASDNTFVGYQSGINSSGPGNTMVGSGTGTANTTGNNNTIIGSEANMASNNLQFATAIGAGAIARQSGTIQIGRDGALHGGNFADVVRVPILEFALKPVGTTDMCFTSLNSDGYSLVGTCGSSIRFKNSMQTYTGGINLVRRLRPVTFNWINGGQKDVGFIAEEVERVEPLLATYNDQGEIEGVKYKQITTVLVNAVNEQQSQIELLQQQLNERKVEYDALKSFICAKESTADLCKMLK